jgi:protein SCO1/2
MAIWLAVTGVIALLLVWRAGCVDGDRRVASGAAGTSSGYSEDAQERTANRAAEIPGSSLVDLPATFVDQDGHERHLAEFRGRLWVASAIYTRCVTVCPRVVEELRELERSHEWAADTSWHGVLFSLDPTYDQPSVLRAFAATRRLDDARWTLLVPDSASLEPLARALGLLAEADPAGGIAHTAVFALVGRDGRIADRRVGIALPRGGLAVAWQRPSAH